MSQELCLVFFKHFVINFPTCPPRECVSQLLSWLGRVTSSGIQRLTMSVSLPLLMCV